MNEGSLRSYQSSKSLPTVREAGRLQRCCSGAGCCQSGFTGFDSAGSRLSTNRCSRGIWLLPLVVGPLLIISSHRADKKKKVWCCRTGAWFRRMKNFHFLLFPCWAKCLGWSWNLFLFSKLVMSNLFPKRTVKELLKSTCVSSLVFCLAGI